MAWLPFQKGLQKNKTGFHFQSCFFLIFFTSCFCALQRRLAYIWLDQTEWSHNSSFKASSYSNLDTGLNQSCFETVHEWKVTIFRIISLKSLYLLIRFFEAIKIKFNFVLSRACFQFLKKSDFIRKNFTSGNITLFTDFWSLIENKKNKLVV